MCRTYAWDTAENATQHAIESAAQTLANTGYAVTDLNLPPQFNELVGTREVINDFERARGMAYEWQWYREQLSEGLAKSIRSGLVMRRERYTDALKRVDECRRLLPEIFINVDVLLTPTVQGEAPLGQQTSRRIHNPPRPSNK